jgi:hypothetical protein
LSRAWLWSRDRLKENGGDGVLFLVTTEILGNVCIYPGRSTFTLSGRLTHQAESQIWYGIVSDPDIHKHV